MPDLDRYLNLMVFRGASDLFLTPGTPLHIKVNGQISAVDHQPLDASLVEALAFSMLDAAQRKAFEQRPEYNLAREMDGVGRFRVNLFRQRGQVAIVIRYLQERIPSFAELNLPPILGDLALRRRGLVLVVGTTGSGKSTTLAAMIEHRNSQTTSHILTVEDPIEFVHRHNHSIVNQREVGIDTLCYADALKNAMREAPDMIMIGEIRDRENMQHALAYAETGHLCVSTLHATNSNLALQRVMSFFPEVMLRQVQLELAYNLTAIVSQRLLRGVNGERLPAVEILMATPFVRDLIEKGLIDDIRGAMEKSIQEGMQTFDQSLFDLYKRGKITSEEAIMHAESVNNLRLMIRLDPKVDRE